MGNPFNITGSYLVRESTNHKVESHYTVCMCICTELDERAGPGLREFHLLTPSGRRGRVDAT